MKKHRIVSAITAAITGLSAVSLLPFAPSSVFAAEIVYNDFEQSYGGWYANSDNVIISAEDGCGTEFSRGMTVKGRLSSADGASSSKGLYLSGGNEYDYSVKVYSRSAERFHVTLTYTDEKTEKDTTVELMSGDTEADTWTGLRASFAAPENTYEYLLTITTDSANDFSFDDVRITAKKPANTVHAAGEKGLKDEFAAYFKVGNILNEETVKNKTLTAMIMKEYNSITCGNQMKPDYIMVQSQSKNDNVAISLKSCASIMDFCSQNHIGLRGHTFVWHAQTPSWFFKKNFDNNGGWVDKNTMDKRLDNYIKNVFAEIQKQYPRLDLYAYDVCNECIANSQSLIDNNHGYREAGDNKTKSGASAWVQIYKDNSYVEKAFTIAKKYAPKNCALYYNDYNEYWDGKRDRIYELCKPLYQKGVLDGIGMQSHISANKTGFGGTDSYIKAMKKFLSIGCDVQITELDVSLEKGKYSLQDQADKYKAIFKAAMDWNKNPQSKGRVKAICMWGLYDKLSWIGAENKPLLFDDNIKPKLAYNTLIGMIPQSQWGSGGGASDVPAADAQPDKNGYFFHNEFESSTEGWESRGSAELMVSGRKGYNSTQSLLVKDRTASWNGAAYTLDDTAFKPGNVYSFSTNVTYFDGDDTDKFYLKLQYTGSDGKTKYASIAEADGIKEQWVQLANSSYKIPSDASDMVIYVETAETTNNFYIDEAIGAKGGTVIKGAGTGSVPQTTAQAAATVTSKPTTTSTTTTEAVTTTKETTAVQYEPVDYILGDIDGDGSITVLEMIAARKGLISGIHDERANKAADVDGSGGFDINDAVILQSYLHGKTNRFPKNR
ncbi:MAG: endo-1,4-beta-xylanase [Ruminococcus sp.]|nr:endo-1,4-beta-xylanase [Ruminococcus sp.]